MNDFGQFVTDNWQPLSASAVVILAVLLAWALSRWLSGSSKVPVKEVIETLQNTYREELRGKDEQIQELTKAVEALKEQAGAPDAPPGIDAALKQLAQGETESAEAIFEQVLERKKGEAASKEAAAAARHIGALAYLHDTQKALSAYTEAVDLDPEDPDGWNSLGLLQRRLGNLDAATKAFERVLALGNKVGDKRVIATAYGNLGLVYRTRGELEKAEEYHLKSLALFKGLDRKEGMASNYGNLGIIYAQREELEKAEEHFLKSLALFKGLGRKEGMASQYGNLGIVYKTRGDLAKAEEYHLKALAIEEDLGHKEGMASQYGNLGNVYLTRGELQKACEAWATSRRLFLEIGAKDRAKKAQRLMDEAGCGREEPGREAGKEDGED